MALITIASKQFDFVRPASRIEWRLYFDKLHRTSSNKTRGSNHTGLLLTSNVYLSGDCTVSGGRPTIPEIAVESTTDVLIGSDVRCTLALFDKDNGRLAAIPLKDFEIPPTPTSTTWADIALYQVPVAVPTDAAAEVISATAIDLTWTDVEDATGYKIERRTGAGAFAEVGTVAQGVGVFHDTGRTVNTQYGYRIRAYRGAKNSGYTAVLSITIAFDAPENIAAVAPAYNYVQVTFDPVGFAQYYKVERKTGAGAFVEIATWVMSLPYFDYGLQGVTTYTYRARATTSDGVDSAYSTEAAVTTPVEPAPTFLLLETASLVLLETSDRLRAEGAN